jgi:peptidoglycan glycosyltransferase
VNAPLRRVGIVTLILFGLLFANLNWVQGYKSDAYRTSQYNGRVQLSQYQSQRGAILDANGAIIATSVATDDSLKYQRTYPLGAAFEPIVGYRPVNLGATGIESAENGFLSGSDTDRLADIFSNAQSAGGNVTLTLQKKVQQVAYDDLANNGGATVGAAVALDPTSGRILAMASSPSFSPTKLVNHDTNKALATYNSLNGEDLNPLQNRAIANTFPPGSTFKVIVSAAALKTGQYTPETVVPAGPSYAPEPGSGYTMTNDAPSVCPQSTVTLQTALTVSCNTAYAQLGVSLGPDAIKAQAQAFGFGDGSLTLAGSGPTAIGVAASQTGSMAGSNGQPDANFVAQSSIGQYEVRMTPLMGAMIAASVANGGVEKKPYLVAKMQDSDLKTTYVGTPSTLRTPITAPVASQLQQMMDSVVQNGTGTSAQIAGYEVGGKTGTADNSVGGQAHRWFIGFAMKDGKPIAAVAVLLVNGGDNGTKSAPKIAGDILKAAIAAEGK